MELTHLIEQLVLEEKKKADRCLRIARRKFNKSSAYRSGAIVRCRQGKIWTKADRLNRLLNGIVKG